MTASISSLTDMIINSLDHGKVLKDKLQAKQLGYILSLLLEKCHYTLSQLFSLNNKEKIQNIIEQQIDQNEDINVTIKIKDKTEFSNIVMDVIQSKTQSQTDPINECPDDTLKNKMATPDPPLNLFNADSPPDLNFDLETPLTPFDDLISINTFGDSMPISQATMDPLSGANSPNVAITNTHNNKFIPYTHKLTTTQTPASSQTPSQPNNLAKDFEKKMKEAIEKKTTLKKKITTQTNIHPQQQPNNTKHKSPITTTSTATTITATATTTQTPVPLYDEYEYEYEYEEAGVPLTTGMAPPRIDLTDESEVQYNIPLSSNGHPTQHTMYNNGHLAQHPHTDYKSAPTPREFPFQWEQSPRNNQPRTPATSPPRISDPMVIHTALNQVAYYADKLDSLHSEYRRVYGEQQQLHITLQNLQSEYNSGHSNLDMLKYQHGYNTIQASYYSMSSTLQNLIIGIYEQFNKMKRCLDAKYKYALDINTRSQFDKFQRYYDEFASSQHHLLTFGEQQQILKEKQERKYNTNNANKYEVPQTPYTHRRRIRNLYLSSDYKQNQNQNQNYIQAHHQQLYNSITPRGNHGNHHYYYNQQQQQQQQQQHNAYKQNYAVQQHAHTTTAIPDRKFNWTKDAYCQQLKNKNGINRTQTPRFGVPHKQENNNNNNNQQKKKPSSGDIPTMGYVYIGSRMSQLISQIGISEGEVAANQARIMDALSDILKNDANFNGFDIISYGSSKHKLFIKDYSDFDFCIRCKKLGVSHVEGIDFIATALKEDKNKSEFDKITIIDSIEDTIHGNYLNNISHISFFDVKSHCFVDLVLNNLPEIGSSRFIAAYETIDPRFALLCRVVKYWSRQRKINDPIAGTLSTYALVLMVINFLQLRRVLPTLSIMIFDRESGLSPWSTQDDYQINVQKYRDFASKNEEPHSKLLVNFFYFYSHKFDFNKDVVSVRTGTYLTKSEKKWNVSTDKHCLCVENPFNSKTNLTKNVNQKSLKRISDEFHRAYQILCESYKIYEVCKLAEN